MTRSAEVRLLLIEKEREVDGVGHGLVAGVAKVEVVAGVVGG